MVVLTVVVVKVCSYDLSGIRVSGNRFVNNAGQEVTLKVRYTAIYVAVTGRKRTLVYIGEVIEIQMAITKDCQ